MTTAALRSQERGAVHEEASSQVAQAGQGPERGGPHVGRRLRLASATVGRWKVGTFACGGRGWKKRNATYQFCKGQDRSGISFYVSSKVAIPFRGRFLPSSVSASEPSIKAPLRTKLPPSPSSPSSCQQQQKENLPNTARSKNIVQSSKARAPSRIPRQKNSPPPHPQVNAKP